MNPELKEYLQNQIKMADDDAAEAAFWAYDALYKGYECELATLLGVKGKMDSRKAFKISYELYSYAEYK